MRYGVCGAWLLARVVVGCLSLSPEANANGLPPGAIYGVGVDNNIYFVDTVSESITLTGSSLSTGVKANGFAADRDRNQVFYFASNGDLGYYDIASNTNGIVATGSALDITPDFPPENATYYAGSYWYIAKGTTANNTLYQAVLTYTGSVPSFSGTPVEYQLTVNGSTSGMMFGDIIVNSLTATLYGSTTPGSGGLFFTLDMAALVTGTTNPVSVISASNPVGLQLAFSEDYTILYGQQYIDTGTSTAGQWYTVDTTLGGYSAISGFVTSPGMRDLAGTAAAPEPSTCALAAAGVVASVLWRRRRRADSMPRANASILVGRTTGRTRSQFGGIRNHRHERELHSLAEPEVVSIDIRACDTGRRDCDEHAATAAPDHARPDLRARDTRRTRIF